MACFNLAFRFLFLFGWSFSSDRTVILTPFCRPSCVFHWAASSRQVLLERPVLRRKRWLPALHVFLSCCSGVSAPVWKTAGHDSHPWLADGRCGKCLRPSPCSTCLTFLDNNAPILKKALSFRVKDQFFPLTVMFDWYIKYSFMAKIKLLIVLRNLHAGAIVLGHLCSTGSGLCKAGIYVSQLRVPRHGFARGTGIVRPQCSPTEPARQDAR